MSPLYLYNNKLLYKDGKLAIDEQCCCDNCPTPTTLGVIDTINFGWTTPPTKNNNSIVAVFTFEDSNHGENGGCGNSANDQPQSGSGQCSFTLTENKQVTLQVNGNVEKQQQNFDYSWIRIEGPGVPATNIDIPYAHQYHVQIKSTAQGQECAMENKNDQLQINIGPGEYTVFFNSNTRDQLYHQGMVHNFNVNW